MGRRGSYDRGDNGKPKARAGPRPIYGGMTVPGLILLHPADNVLVCVAAVQAGDAMTIDGEVVTAPEAVAVGHKVARRALAAGDKVFKYGAPIGSMTRPAERGGWVHMHNMKSDYIATHTRQTVTEEGL